MYMCFKTHHDDVIKWNHFPRYWPFLRGIHRSPLDSPRKSQWRGALMFSSMYALPNDWANNRDSGDLSRHGTHCDVTLMLCPEIKTRTVGWWKYSLSISCTTWTMMIPHRWYYGNGISRILIFSVVMPSICPSACPCLHIFVWTQSVVFISLWCQICLLCDGHGSHRCWVKNISNTWRNHISVYVSRLTETTMQSVLMVLCYTSLENVLQCRIVVGDILYVYNVW